MTTYRESGVDQTKGDSASSVAYKHAMATFASRKGMIGEAVEDEGGFAGLLDMGDFYLVQNADGTGSKMSIALALKKYDTLGADLVAMVADDAICCGAEVIALTNTLDVPSADQKIIDGLMKSLAKYCSEQRIVIPGGEIAQVPGSVSEYVWNATSVGIVSKKSVLRPSEIKPCDAVLALKSAVARSNGFSLIRKILTDKFGKDWVHAPWKNGKSWGEITLTPSIIYHDALLSLLGRYGEERVVNVKGLAHVTGGGIPGNLPRILKHAGVGADLTNLWMPNEALVDLIKLGNVPLLDAYETWNMGTGMFAVVEAKDVQHTIELLKKKGINAVQAGLITEDPVLKLTTYTGEMLAFDAATGDVL